MKGFPVLDHVLESLKSDAAASMAQYPQYAGKFNDYVLVKIKKDVKTKMGLAFSKNEVTIAEKHPYAELPDCISVWSFKNKTSTVIKAKLVEYY
jgi:hypothetical protein